jgi:hypothetical protein
MKNGCLLFAHNGNIDYGSQAMLAATLVKKYLNVPVSLVSDKETINDINSKFKNLSFDNIIEIEKPNNINQRRLYDQENKDYKIFDFINGNRHSAYKLTPYDRTLVIDTDFLVLSDNLSKYWSSDEFFITPGMLLLQDDNTDPREHKVGPYSIDMLWATNIMFSKNEETEIFFNLIEFIKQEYYYYSNLYEFHPGQYRNDFVFSIACHIMSGHGLYPWHKELPIPLFFDDKCEILKIKENGDIIFLIDKHDTYVLAKSNNQDVHIMNKKSLLANLEQLLKLVDYER